jgi:N-acetyl-gamma-glutamyl-phosphate reductase
MIKAAIVGGSGYTGGELARLLCRHPKISLEAMTSRQHAGVKVSKVHTYLDGFVDLRFDEKLRDGADFDVTFVAAPHGASMGLVPDLLKRGTRVIDLSGDYRLPNQDTYRKWYGMEHKDVGNLGIAAYGIPELFGEEVKSAKLVANPGCYPTCSILGLAPLFASGMVEGGAIVDAKSGTSGAGHEPTKVTHHPNCGSNIIPYKVGCHRHTPEIQMALERVSGCQVEVIFAPHLIPVVRGMLCTSYVKLKEPMDHEALFSLYGGYYAGRRFIRLDPVPSIPSIVGSNFCEIGFELAGERHVVVMSVLDNLVKGGSGQAVQNANIMFGLDESSGLDFPGLGV